jgi:outer membrane immunogenic protein
MRCSIVGTALLSLVVSPAFAADLPVKARPMAPAAVVAYNWTGCYIGGNVGAGWVRDEQTRIGTTAGVVLNDNFGSGTHTDFIGGGQVGCDYQFASNWVIGVQGMVNFGSNTERHNIPITFFSAAGVPLTFAEETTLKNTVTATARLGYLFAPQFLGYVKGGAAWARVDHANFLVAPAVSLSETASGTRTGWTVGGGVEWMFAQGWSAFGEFNYLDFGTRDITFTSAPGAVGAASIIRTKLTESQALFGLNYKFGWAGPVVAKY